MTDIKFKEDIAVFIPTSENNETKPFFSSRLEFAKYLNQNLPDQSEERLIKIRKLIDVSIARKKMSPTLLDYLKMVAQYKTEESSELLQTLRTFWLDNEDEDTQDPSTKSYDVDFTVCSNDEIKLSKKFQFLEEILTKEVLLRRNKSKAFQINLIFNESNLENLYFLKSTIHIYNKCQYRFESFVFIHNDSNDLLNNSEIVDKIFDTIATNFGYLEKQNSIYPNSSIASEICDHKYVLGEFLDFIIFLKKLGKKTPNAVKVSGITKNLYAISMKNQTNDKHFVECLSEITSGKDLDLADIFYATNSLEKSAFFYTNIAYLEGLNYQSRFEICQYFLKLEELNARHFLNRTITIPNDFIERASQESKKLLYLFVKINMSTKIEFRIINDNSFNENIWLRRNFVYIRPDILDKSNRPRIYIPIINSIGNLRIKELNEDIFFDEIIQTITHSLEYPKVVSIPEILDQLNLDEQTKDELDAEINYLKHQLTSSPRTMEETP